MKRSRALDDILVASTPDVAPIAPDMSMAARYRRMTEQALGWHLRVAGKRLISTHRGLATSSKVSCEGVLSQDSCLLSLQTCSFQVPGPSIRLLAPVPELILYPDFPSTYPGEVGWDFPPPPPLEVLGILWRS